MTVTKTRALLAALMLASSAMAVTQAYAQDREVNDQASGNRFERKPAAPAAKSAAAGEISAAVGKPLNTAIAAINAKKWPDALAAAKEAQGLAKTDYEKMKVNQFMTLILINSGDVPGATTAAEAAADTAPDAIPAEDKLQVYRNGATLALNAKHTDKALAYAKQLETLNSTDPAVQDLVGKALYAGGDPGAISYFQKQVDTAIAAGHAPSHDALQMLMLSQIKAKDEAAAEKTMVQSVLYFNDKNDWKQIIDVTMSTPGIRDIDAIWLGRLLMRSGADVSKENADLIGTTSQKAALYGDAQMAQSKGATLNLDPARVASDKAGLTQQVQMGASQNGVFNIKLAEALYGYGMYDQAESVARTAQTKGGADPSEVSMVIGMSQVGEGKYADAVTTFGQVQGGSPATPRVAELWSVFAKIKGGMVPGPATAAAAAPAPAAAAR
jgi:hypothetical protein